MTDCQGESEPSGGEGGALQKKPPSEAPPAAARVRNAPQRTIAGARPQKGLPNK